MPELRAAVLRNARPVIAALTGDCVACRRMAEVSIETAGLTLPEVMEAAYGYER
jgi:hypothetical protein